MSDAYDIAHRRYRAAREKYLQLDSELAVARAEMNKAEREASIEWRKIVDAAHPPADRGGSDAS